MLLLSCFWKNLAWIQNIIRIKRLLNAAHDIQGRAVLPLPISDFANVDPVLAGGGAAQFQRVEHHLLVKILCLLIDVFSVGNQNVHIVASSPGLVRKKEPMGL